MTPPPHLRHKLPQFLAFAVFAVAAGALALAAQPPETEDPKAKPSKKIPLEDEDPKAAPKKKIVVDDPDTKTKSGGPSSLPDQKLDELIRQYVEQLVPVSEIEKALGPWVRDLIRLIDLNEYRRRQAAPVLKVSAKAFGIGRRLPIAKRWSPFA